MERIIKGAAPYCYALLRIVGALLYRRFPRSEMLQQSGMRLHGFCPENRMTCDGKVDRFILPCGWLSKGL